MFYQVRKNIVEALKKGSRFFDGDRLH
ncbi:hypothetical protein MBGDF03_01149 [Thermoplasmatales archaeon SCGC AB-540-F20]|nr:hypothetical protein MBGDF03_01149 [Thermoplasmatales archaeon SCGC AB-540-F20]